jgi:hypothetical protein
LAEVFAKRCVIGERLGGMFAEAKKSKLQGHERAV